MLCLVGHRVAHLPGPVILHTPTQLGSLSEIDWPRGFKSPPSMLAPCLPDVLVLARCHKRRMGGKRLRDCSDSLFSDEVSSDGERDAVRDEEIAAIREELKECSKLLKGVSTELGQLKQAMNASIAAQKQQSKEKREWTRDQLSTLKASIEQQEAKNDHGPRALRDGMHRLSEGLAALANGPKQISVSWPKLEYGEKLELTLVASKP